MKNQTPPNIHRRKFLKTGSSTLIVLTVAPGGVILGGNNAWAMTATNLQAETFATLVQTCRDIYPHDHLADSYYAKVVEGFDKSSGESEEDKAMFEEGVAKLDKAAMEAHGVRYRNVGWEIQRVSILRDMEGDPFFQKLRGDLVTGIYNNPDVWEIFGYEGESASKGGYLNRGFDDIDWLDQV
ncbi:MAG: gluconate 2-dehydrogenase subunit 3 family protein [Acidiferrobacterales bacterium]|nr:gluconate 2-dehydrogenase subunit 3 family protein [Acidiferrobacterales bacterium]